MTKRSISVVLVSALLLTGCAAAPDTYYTLAASAPAGKVMPDAAAIFIELAPVAVPERLARPQMVITRAGKGGERSAEVALLEQHRWASSFENELRDALAGGIATGLSAIDTTKGGHQPGQNPWRIAVQLRQFDAVESAQIDAALSWTVRRTDGARSFACQWAGREPVAAGMGALAQGAQRITSSAAQAIARHVAALEAQADGSDAFAACRQ